MLELVELASSSSTIRACCRAGCSAGHDRPRVAFEPSILLMDGVRCARRDDPRRMNQEVLRIWEQTGITVVFVTHFDPRGGLPVVASSS
jgi:ABC-type taurine transport system ATPase subunit